MLTLLRCSRESPVPREPIVLFAMGLRRRSSTIPEASQQKLWMFSLKRRKMRILSTKAFFCSTESCSGRRHMAEKLIASRTVLVGNNTSVCVTYAAHLNMYKLPCT